jgi:hypothetical protein
MNQFPFKIVECESCGQESKRKDFSKGENAGTLLCPICGYCFDNNFIPVGITQLEDQLVYQELFHF